MAFGPPLANDSIVRKVPPLTLGLSMFESVSMVCEAKCILRDTGVLILKIIDPQCHLAHLCRPFLLNLLTSMNGEEVHLSCHGSARVNQLSMDNCQLSCPKSPASYNSENHPLQHLLLQLDHGI